MRRVVFLGTPGAAVPTLRELALQGSAALVVTQPDRPRGRSGRPLPPPVKEVAAELGIPVVQPESGPELLSLIASEGPFDAGVVVAYGRILGREVLETPRRGFLNVHFSLLPRWRGAAPVARALMAGDEMTGVTIIQLDEGLDTGAVLTAQAIDIAPDDDAGRLTERLSGIGARLLMSVLDAYLAGDLTPVRQSDEGVTYADKITASDRPLDISGSVDAFVNQVRGLAPEPAATLEIDGDRHKIFKATGHGASLPAGIWEDRDGLPVVGLGGGSVALLELQPPGRNRQTGPEWVRGRHRSGGSVG